MSQTTVSGVDVQEAIDRMVKDVVRVPCSKVLLSPEMYSGCLDRMFEINRRTGELGRPPASSNLFVRGVLVEKCEYLTGTQYALIPKSPENPITVNVNGVPLEFIPPFKPVQPVVPDEQRPFHHFDTQKLERALDITNCHIDDSIEFVAGQMLDPEVRKRVLEARVFEPE